MAESVRTSWHSLPNEMKVLVMSQIPDIASLHNFVCADVNSSAAIFSEFFADILPSVLGESIPFDIQELICILISIKDTAPVRDRDSQFPFVMDGNVYFQTDKRRFQFHEKPRDPIKALCDLSRTSKAVEFFASLYPQVFAARHKYFRNKSLSKVEKHRLKRALWCFEVCSALNLAWNLPCKDVIKSMGTARIPRLVNFLSGFQAWEIEELASVYEFLELAVFQYASSSTQLPHGNPGNIHGCHAATIRARMRNANLPQYFRSWHSGLVSTHTSWKVRARAQILSQGLVFLEALQSEPRTAREIVEMRALDRALSDDFIFAALSKMNFNRGSPFCILSSPRQSECRSAWKEAEGHYSACASEGNENWQKLTSTFVDAWRFSDRGPPLETFRSWGLAIWDRFEWASTWRLSLPYIRSDKCECPFCCDIGS